MSDTLNQQAQRFLLVRVANNSMALSLANVREAVGMQEYTKVPCSEPHFLGLMGLRGTVVPLIDLAKKLKLEGQTDGTDENDRGIVICISDDKLYGLVVDSIETVVSLEASEIRRNPRMDTTIPNNFIMGIHQSENQLVLLVDTNLLLGVSDRNFIATAHEDKQAS